MGVRTINCWVCICGVVIAKVGPGVLARYREHIAKFKSNVGHGMRMQQVSQDDPRLKSHEGR